MAEDLGEIRVNIESEGADDAAGTIGDAVADGADDGDGRGVGPGGAAFAGAEAGGILGGISTKLAGILGFVSFLATLKPIQELLGGLQRLFSVAILPLVALLSTFLRPILQKLLRFIGDFSFDNVVRSLREGLNNALNQLSSMIGTQIASVVPGVNRSVATSGTRQGITTAALGAGGAVTGLGGAAGPVFNLTLDWLSEQSNTSLQSNVADSGAEVNQRNTAGSQ